MSNLTLRTINAPQFSRAPRAAMFCGLLALGLSHAALAATLCVNPAAASGSGCYTTIGAAVKAAAANDTINVAIGQYAEAVVVNKPLALVGAGTDSTIINAQGLPNGFYVDGLDNPGMSNVLITGFTVVNANYEGILVTNSSYVLITNNHVASNDQSLNYASSTCSGQPIFETEEGDDCGEGIHLIGVDHTTLAGNNVELNSGGILLTDETGPTYAIRITGNNVHDNALDCGVTLASHPPSPSAASKAPYGIFNNDIVGNTVSGNGIIGQGAGVGIFAQGPGNLNFGNNVIGNVLTHNGLPGVTMHNHAAPPGAPTVNVNDNVIIGNFIAGNGADTEDATTPGPTGINIFSVAPAYGTEIVNNTIQNEAVDVVMNNPGSMELHLNNLLDPVGVANLSKGVVNASQNFFGCATGPGTTGCGGVNGSSVSSTPFLSGPSPAAPAPPAAGNGPAASANIRR